MVVCKLLSFVIITCYFPVGVLHAQVENSAPTIVIQTPSQKSMFEWNSMIHYSIQVVDREDGNSIYEEIDRNKVVVLIKYIKDSMQLEEHLSSTINTYPQPLHWMLNSTCFSCHSSKSKLIGPSYDLIARRYPDNIASVEELAKKVVLGTTGTWGDIEMPPHPDVTLTQARQIISWILKNGADKHKDYFVGVEGSFRTIDKPKAGEDRGVYVITASYKDQGLREIPNSGKLGQANRVIKISKD